MYAERFAASAYHEQYLGGSVALYPISITDTDGLLLTDSPRTEIWPDFPYTGIGHGPNKGRQRQCHVHQVLEDKRGLLYAPDLGSDRVWILRRDEMELELCGWLQCPPGTGSRHAVLTPDGMFPQLHTTTQLIRLRDDHVCPRRALAHRRRL
jgi:6-phosphogluconolactonase (cycloisomerase 2 family)